MSHEEPSGGMTGMYLAETALQKHITYSQLHQKRHRSVLFEKQLDLLLMMGYLVTGQEEERLQSATDSFSIFRLTSSNGDVHYGIDIPFNDEIACAFEAIIEPDKELHFSDLQAGSWQLEVETLFYETRALDSVTGPKRLAAGVSLMDDPEY